jgi:hypothetical protein
MWMALPGFNFQHAWTSGFIAGKAIAERLTVDGVFIFELHYLYFDNQIDITHQLY